jgi:DNA-binding transcriptional ArsR family regulator
MADTPPSTPEHFLVTKELADMLGVLSHPQRIRIIEELRDQERDVNSLQLALGINHSGVSQHLSVLRAHRLVAERRQGRHVFYHLPQPQLARWLLDGIDFLAGSVDVADHVRLAIESVRAHWANHTVKGQPDASAAG